MTKEHHMQLSWAKLFAGRSRATDKLKVLSSARRLVLGVSEAGLGHTLDCGCVRPALCFLHRNELAALRASSNVESLAFVGGHLGIFLLELPELPRLREPTPHMIPLHRRWDFGLVAPRGLRLIRGTKAGPVWVGFGVSGTSARSKFFR